MLFLTFLSRYCSLTSLLVLDIFGIGVVGCGFEQLYDTCMSPQFIFRSLDLWPPFFFTLFSDSIICLFSSFNYDSCLENCFLLFESKLSLAVG